jgi:transcriptional regulator with XRE-family HTH domain
VNARPDPKTGTRIARRRQELGLSQRDVATAHVSYAYISRIEAGTRTPSWATLIEIADKLETSALYLGAGREHDCPVCKR